MAELQKSIRDALFPVVVLGKNCCHFGLSKKPVAKQQQQQQQLGNSGERHEIGGYLRKGRSNAKAGGIVFGEPSYFLVDGESFCYTKNGEIAERIQFPTIVSVTAHSEANETFLRLVWIQTRKDGAFEQRVWDLSADRDHVISWICLLQLRSKTYEVLLDLDKEKALRLALWLQSLFRGFKSRKKLHRRASIVNLTDAVASQQQQGNVISRMVTGLLGTADSSSSEDEAEEDVQLSFSSSPRQKVKKPPAGSSLVSFLARTFVKPPQQLLQPPAVQVVAVPPTSALTTTSSTLVAETKAKAPQEVVVVEQRREEMEDEVWENQRWGRSGWSSSTLQVGERGPFSDRLGMNSFAAIASIPPPPAGWDLTAAWTLDRRPRHCSAEGWTYAVSFGALDSNLASGRENTAPSPRWLVRRRRYIRVRSRPAADKPLFALSGWLGMQGMMSGRWTSNFAFVPSQHLVAFCYFRDWVKVFTEEFEFRMNLNRICKKEARIKHIDNCCRVSDAMATPDRPGLFSIHLTGEAEPRQFNAFSADLRAVWVSLLTQIAATSGAPDYETIVSRRSVRKGALWELARARKEVKAVAGEVKTLFSMLAPTTGETSPTSNPDSLQPDVQQRIGAVREEYRKRTLSAGSLGEDETSPPSPVKRLSKFKLPTFKRTLPPPTPMVTIPIPVSPATLILSPTAAVAAIDSPPPTKMSAETTTARFEIPPPLDNVMFDGHFEMPVDALDAVLFREEEFSRALLASEKMFDIEMDEWSDGANVGSEHRRRYKMPRVGIVPPGPSLHLFTRTQSCPGVGFTLDQVVSTPEMPFGTSFTVEFRYVLVGDGDPSAARTRLIISQRVVFLKFIMAQAFVKGGTKREIANYYRNYWPTFTRNWLAQNRNIVASTVVEIEDEVVTNVVAETTVTSSSVAAEPPKVSTTSESNSWLVWGLCFLCISLLIHSVVLSCRLAILEERFIALRRVGEEL